MSVWKHLLTFVAIFIEKNFFPCTLFSFVYSISNICLLIKVATLWLSCLIIEKFSFKKLIKNWFVVLMKKLLLLKLIVFFSEERNVEFLYISLTILLKSCRYRKFPIPITKNKNCLLPITEYYLFQMSCSFKWSTDTVHWTKSHCELYTCTWGVQYTLSEMKCSGETEMLHELVHDTSRKSENHKLFV